MVVLFIFVSLLATLSYNFNSKAKEMELKSEATSIAVSEIENLKAKNWNEIEQEKTTLEEIKEIKQGFFREVIIQDYHEINSSKTMGIVKKVTVKIQYQFKSKVQEVELATLITREG